MTKILATSRILRLPLIVGLTFLIGLYLFKPTYHLNPFKLGVICKICSTPTNGDTVAIKLAGENVISLAKIIATPAETIEINNGVLTINQVRTTIELPANFNYPTRSNDQFEFFVIIFDSSFSKIIDFGRIKQSRIIGKVIYLW